MAVPIEIPGLESLLTERVYIKWIDEDDSCWTLGSCMPRNKKNVDIIMKVVCDSKRHIHIQFSLKVAIKISGKRHHIYMLLAIPPHVDFEYASKDLPIQELNGLSHLDASALHEAGISNLERVIVLKFDSRRCMQHALSHFLLHNSKMLFLIFSTCYLYIQRDILVLYYHFKCTKSK